MSDESDTHPTPHADAAQQSDTSVSVDTCPNPHVSSGTRPGDVAQSDTRVSVDTGAPEQAEQLPALELVEFDPRRRTPLAADEGPTTVVPFAPPDPGRRRLDEATWWKLVEAFRHQANHVTAAKLCGVDPRTAKRAFEDGLGYDFARKPIREVLLEQKAEATPAGRAKVAGTPIDSATVRIARANVRRSLEITTSLLEGAGKLAKELEHELGLFTGDPGKAVKAIRDVVAVSKLTLEAAQMVTSAEERLEHAGLKERQAGADASMTHEEAEKELRELESLLARAKARGGPGA